MNKQLYKILIIATIYIIIVHSCCRNTKDYVQIQDFNILIRNISNDNIEYGYMETINDSNLLIVINFNYEFIAQATIPNIAVTECYALKCYAGELGLKPKINTINISSNNSFNNYSAGSSLNEIITCSYNYYEVSEDHIEESTRIKDETIEDLVLSMNKMTEYFLNDDFCFYINEKPDSIKNHKFTVSIEFVDGSIIEEETVEIIWE